MPNAVKQFSAFADQMLTYVFHSPAEWRNYLKSASRLYKYRFAENLLIHGQCPEASAVATTETWRKVGRTVNTNAKGIAVIDDTGDTDRLKILLDIADTIGQPNRNYGR